MNDFFAFLGFLFALVLVIGLLVWHFSRSRSLLEQWAANNGFELLRAEYRAFRRGPYFWTTSKGQAVYYVEVRDRQGKTRTGWVRCGSWWWGLFSDQVEVRWKE